MTIGKRSMMTLYSSEMDIYSHQVRIVLAEKSVAFDIVHVDLKKPPEDLLELNPYQTLPTLIDGDLVLYEAQIIMEYLDERLPHPPLLPAYPINRAKSRLMMHRIKLDWYSLLHKIETASLSKKALAQARNELAASLTALNPVFADQPYFLSKDFSMIDCYIAPLLWRLPALGITLTEDAKDVIAYSERMFKRNAFQVSLTDAEYEIQEKDNA